MTLFLSPKARPVAHILALLPVLLVIALLDMALPRWAGVADLIKLVDGWAQAHRLLSALWWLVLGLFLFLALEGVIWRAMQARSIAPPKLLVDLVRALVFVVAVFGALSALFDQTLTGLLATSGVVAIVLGFALQSTLADLFSGIALNLERPFRVGDWLKLDSGSIGQIVQTNWRATHLRTLDGNDVVIPNSRMAAAQLTNFNLPAKSLRQTIAVPLPGDVPPARVQRVLVACGAAPSARPSRPAAARPGDRVPGRQDQFRAGVLDRILPGRARDPQRHQHGDVAHPRRRRHFADLAGRPGEDGAQPVARQAHRGEAQAADPRSARRRACARSRSWRRRRSRARRRRRTR